MALGREAGDDALVAEALCWESAALTFLGKLDRAGTLAEEAFELATATGSARLAGTARMCQAMARRSDDLERARAYFAEAITTLRSAGDLVVLAMTVNNSLAGEPCSSALAARHSDIAETIELGELLGFAFLVRNGNLMLGELAARAGDVATAHAQLRSALQARDGDLRLIAAALWLGARTWSLDADHRRAAELLGADAILRERLRAEAPSGSYHPRAGDEEDRERLSRHLREALGEEELAHRLGAGGRLSLRDACDLALGRRELAG